MVDVNLSDIDIFFFLQAAILQQTAEYIYSLEQEKTRLLSQNCQLKRLVGQHEGGELPPKKRLKTEFILPAISAESADEGRLIYRFLLKSNKFKFLLIF